MASLATVGTPDPAVYAAEGERFAELTGTGQITDFFLSVERTRGWMVVHAETQQHAREVVESLPLARYWTVELTALAGSEDPPSDPVADTAQSADGDQARERRNVAVLRRFYGLFNGEPFRSGDFDELDEILAPGFTDHDPLPQQGPGIEGLKDAFDFYYAAFSDFGIDVLDMVAQDDMVAVRFMTSGTFDGQFMGVQGTGQRFQAAAFGLIRFDDTGRPTDRWGQADTAALTHQLGLA